MFSRQLKLHRTKAGVSQKKLADQLFVSQQAVARWETDKATPNPEMILKIAQALNVSVNELVGEKNPATESGDGQADKLAKALLDVGLDVDKLSDGEIMRLAQLAKVALDK